MINEKENQFSGQKNDREAFYGLTGGTPFIAIQYLKFIISLFLITRSKQHCFQTRQTMNLTSWSRTSMRSSVLLKSCSLQAAVRVVAIVREQSNLHLQLLSKPHRVFLQQRKILTRSLATVSIHLPSPMHRMMIFSILFFLAFRLAPLLQQQAHRLLVSHLLPLRPCRGKQVMSATHPGTKTKSNTFLWKILKLLVNFLYYSQIINLYSRKIIWFMIFIRYYDATIEEVYHDGTCSVKFEGYDEIEICKVRQLCE